MEENQKPPILVTSDVKFAIMKDGSVYLDDSVQEGSGMFDVAVTFVDFIEHATQRQFLAYIMAHTYLVDPAIRRRCEEELNSHKGERDQEE